MSSTARAPAQNDDDFDDELFGDYDIDDAMQPLNIDMSVDVPSKKSTATAKRIIDNDDDIKITRARRPTVKLDAERLLAPSGLPKLKRTAPEQLGKKLKGKGHEYKDAERILNFYQLWADDLYRKANFRDTISIIEKLGHTKRVQMARGDYLDEYTKRDPPEDLERLGGPESAGDAGGAAPSADADMDDLYAPGPARKISDDNGGSLFLGGVDDSEDDVMMGQPDEDELEALMAMDDPVSAVPNAAPNTAPPAQKKAEPTRKPEDDEFDNDFEAIDDWDELLDTAIGGSQAQKTDSQTVGAEKENRNTGPSKPVRSLFGAGTGQGPPEEPAEDELEAWYGV